MPIRLFCFASTALLLGLISPLGAPPVKQEAKTAPANKQINAKQKTAKAIQVQGAKKSASIKTWQDALAAAYDFSPQIRTARTEVRRTQESKKQAYAEWVPDASGYATYDIEKHNVKKGAQNTTDRLQQPMGYGVRLKQNIFASGGTLARTRKASDAIMAAELAMYAVKCEIDHEPAFNWWVRPVLKRRARIVASVKGRAKLARDQSKGYNKRTSQFGIQVPRTLAEAVKLDEANGNTLWQDAVAKEMDHVIACHAMQCYH